MRPDGSLGEKKFLKSEKVTVHDGGSSSRADSNSDMEQKNDDFVTESSDGGVLDQLLPSTGYFLCKQFGKCFFTKLSFSSTWLFLLP